MDIGKHLSALETERSRQQTRDAKTVLVAPMPSVVHEDGLIVSRVCVATADILAAAEGEVLLFPESASELLRMVVEYREVFGLHIVVMLGLPDADYAPWFDGIVWGIDSVSYSSVVSELSVERDAIQKAAEKKKSQFEREREQISRADGSVRANDNFTTVGASLPEDNGDDDDSGDE